MSGKIYGYTKEQNEERQLIALTAFGIKRENIVLDKQSGKDFERPGYQRLMKKIRPGDILVVKSIDRLGRNYSEILEQWRIINQEKNASIVVLDMPLLDTRQGKDLTGELVANIVLQLLSYVAETEREFIRQRQAEGIAAAKANGVHLGRKPMEPPPEFYQTYVDWASGDISARGAARKLGITHPTFLKWVKNTGNKGTP